MILTWLIFAINLNLSNSSGFGIFGIGFQPYLALLGNMAWGMIFGFPAAAIYVNAERKYMGLFGYLTIIGFFFSILFYDDGPAMIFMTFLGLILVLIVSLLLYKVFVETKS